MQLEETSATANTSNANLDEVIEVTPEVEPKSMDDTIRETLRSLQEKGITPDVSESAPDTPEEKAQAIRDKQGKFAAKETAPLDPIAPEPVVPSSAPNTWRKEAQDAWGKADPMIRAEVERREADFHRGIEQYKTAANYGQSMERAIQPFAATIQSLGISPDKAVGELMAADHKLRYGSPEQKNAYFASLAQSYGIDLGNLSAPEQQYIDPNVQALQNEVQQQRAWIQNQSLLGQQQADASLNSEISKFAADPTHSHFESVKGHMAALLQAGQVPDLSSAYEQAIYANPTTRALVIAEQQNAARAEASKKAQLAKTAASVNTRSRPSMPVSQPIGDMTDTIRATLRRIQSA